MSAAKHRYELWLLNGGVAARYKTMGQALLGALWRSKKLQTPIYIWRAGKNGHCAATVHGLAVSDMLNKAGACAPARFLV